MHGLPNAVPHGSHAGVLEAVFTTLTRPLLHLPAGITGFETIWTGLTGILLPVAFLAIEGTIYSSPASLALLAFRTALLSGESAQTVTGDLPMLGKMPVVLLATGILAFLWSLDYARSFGALA